MLQTETTDEQTLLPIGDVARLLGVSVETVRRWDRSGQITSSRTPGGQRRFPMSEVDRIRNGSPDVSPDHLNVARVAEELNLSPRAVLHRIQKGQIAARKLGPGTAEYVITRAEVERVKAEAVSA